MKESIGERLRSAVYRGNISEVRELIPQLEPKKRGECLDWAAWSAVMSGNLAMLDLLLKAGLNPNTRSQGATLLSVAAGGGHLAMVKRLLAVGADIRKGGCDSMRAALAANKMDVARYLISRGADWPTPMLLHAAEKGKLAEVKRALAAGADIEAIGGLSTEHTPLMSAAWRGHPKVVRFLLKHGAKPNRRIREWTALILAAGYSKSLETVEALLEGGADIHMKHYDETVLMFAAAGGCLPIVKRLVDAGADIHARDKHHGKAVLDYARDGKNKEVIAYLSRLGLAAERDGGRQLVWGLARKYGGRPVEHIHGFLLNSKLAGHKCQFHVDGEALGVVVFGLHYRDAELKHMAHPGLVIGARQIHAREGRLVEVKAASKVLSLPVRVPPAAATTSGKFTLKFCRKHKRRLNQLNLSGRELFGITAESTRFFWVGTDLNAVLPRLQLFASFLQEISRAPQPNRMLFEREWLIKPVPKARGAHLLGGEREQPIACPHCNCATNLMARIDLGDPALPNTSLGRGSLPVFWCLSCLEWAPSFFDISGPVPKPLFGKRKSATAKVEDGEDGIEEEHLQLVPLAAGKKAARKSKIGGVPSWIQLEETPDCPKCERPMAFALQLASDSRISFCDMGMLYAFTCPECRITASLIQSH